LQTREKPLNKNIMSTKEKKSVTYEFSEEKPTVVEEPLFTYPALNLDLSKRYTYADYLTWVDDVRRELIDGFIYLMSAPSTLHARFSHLASWFLEAFVRQKKGKCQVFQAPFDVRFPKEGHTEDKKVFTVVQPDICVICDLSKIDNRGCIGAPDLIVEVLSPSTAKKDWTKKFNLYEKEGVREYWIADPKDKVINVFLLQTDGKYDDGTVYFCHEKAPVHIFDGLEIDLKELFED
jgi:Uma2 family endonuclease